MSKMPSMNLPFNSVCRLSPVLGSNESNLGAVGRVFATGQPGNQSKRLILQRKKERGTIVGHGNLRLGLCGEVSKWIHTGI